MKANPDAAKHDEVSAEAQILIQIQGGTLSIVLKE
jgi:hypothetical protein